MSFAYSTFVQGEIKAAEDLRDEASAACTLTAGHDPAAVAAARAALDAAQQLLDTCFAEHERRCTCCFAGWSYVDRWGGCAAIKRHVAAACD